jgi:hypothetical protein
MGDFRLNSIFLLNDEALRIKFSCLQCRQQIFMDCVFSQDNVLQKLINAAFCIFEIRRRRC